MSETITTPRVVRVITLPVREIVDSEAKLFDTFRESWRLSTDLANWCQRELALHDPGLRTPGVEKIAKYVPKMFPGERNLYQRVNAACPFRDAFEGCAGSMGAVIKAVEDSWRSHPRFGRFTVLWRGEARPCVFQYPYPWPVRSQELKISKDDQGNPCVSLTIKGGRVTVRLARGGEFRRQLKQFDVLMSDPSRVKQAKITGRRAGGRLVGVDMRLVGSFDACGPRESGKTATITTGPSALLTVQIDGREEPFVYHGDELKGVIAVHDGWRHRVAVDLKHEKRWPSEKRERIVNGPRVQARYDKSRNRLRTARQQVVAMVTGFLTRQGVQAVSYRDADKSFLPRFDWSGLRGMMSSKCEELGISFQHQAGADDDTE